MAVEAGCHRAWAFLESRRADAGTNLVTAHDVLSQLSARTHEGLEVVRAFQLPINRAEVSNAAAAVFDQVLLSGVGFALGASFIYLSTPAEYGEFVFLQSIFYLLASVQNAAVNTPMMVLSPRLSSEDARRFEQGLLTGLLTYGLPASVLTLLAVRIVAAGRLGFGACVLVGVCFMPLLVRDYLRAREFSISRAVDALRRDSLYAVIALGSVAGLAATGSLGVVQVYVVLALASAASIGMSLRQHLAARVTRSDVSRAYRQSWTHARWSLVGATASWMQGNAYVYIPFFVFGASSVAVSAAARLAMTPIGLLTQSWSNVQRPLLSRLVADQQGVEARRACYRGAVVLSLVLAGYVAALFLALHVAPAGLLPAHYQDMRLEILMWSGIMLFQIIRSSLSWLLQASLEFEALAKLGLWTAIGTLVVTAPAVVAFGGVGGLVGMLAAEVALAGLLFRNARGR